MSEQTRSIFRWFLLIASVVSLYLTVAKGSIPALVVFLIAGALAGAWKPYFHAGSSN